MRDALARVVAQVAALDPAPLEESELVGVITDCARLASAAAGLKLAAVAALCDRFEEHDHGPVATGVECAGGEVSLALGLTPATTDRLVVLAQGLNARLSATAVALRGGRIGEDKARVLVEETSALDDATASRVEERALSWAPRLTTPRFRWRVRALVHDADPHGAAARRDRAVATRRVGVWDDGEGTAALGGFGLPSADAIEAYQYLDSVARQLHRAEDSLVRGSRSLEQVRADLFVDLLRGRGVATVPPREAEPDPLLPPASGCAPVGAPAVSFSAVGRLHLSIPFATLVGSGQAAGEAAGYGPLLADVARQLAHRSLVSRGATRACWTVTDEEGRGLAHGVTTYQPSARMRAEILARDATCAFPTCGQPATRCDLDHTIPHHAGGVTCPCNLAPLCRRHHRLKQHRDWWVDHPWPGHLRWRTPTGVIHTRDGACGPEPP
ncbi:DUF222 domain-containing protein [Spiractinospora alimapuensis]|uniref:HNH endonuclease signature motif containing protein n=1 Tax=Spiractinospora alimapuensis TaxID=2820884 RepID=UPI001F3766B7|nr:HNH endonuclease signature motif containing protein [Spiractinospora alimapuensis]QVQ52584.1 DUF222 domain-containing protein [Spiractinospora alimapuensis]